MQLTISLPLDFITTKGLEEKPLSPKEVLKDFQSCIPTADVSFFLTRENMEEDQEETGVHQNEKRERKQEERRKKGHICQREKKKKKNNGEKRGNS